MTQIGEVLASRVAHRKHLATLVVDAQWPPAGLKRLPGGVVDLISVNSPQDTLRRVEHAERIMMTHSSTTPEGMGGIDDRLWCAGHDLSVRWPCEEFLSLAACWGVYLHHE